MTTPPSRRTLPLVALLALLAAPAAFAQADAAVLIGNVTAGDSKAPLAKATVILTSPNLQGQRLQQTDETGLYRVSQLPPGEYRIRFVKGGYKTVTYAEVRLRAGQTGRINAELPVAPPQAPAAPAAPATPENAAPQGTPGDAKPQGNP